MQLIFQTLNSNSGKFYYDQLDSYAKLIYDKIYENKENMKTGNYTIDYGKTFNTLLNSEDGKQQINTSYQAALDAYFLDNPDVFYIDVTKLYLLMNARTIGRKTTYTVTIGGENGASYFSEGFYSKEQIENCLNQIEYISNNIIEDSLASDYVKIKEIHNWLVDNITYDQTISKNNIRTIYGAIIEKEVVCEGYAKAFKYLLDKAGIESIIIIGYGTNSKGQTEEHAWNYIKLDGAWYAVDVTWDDPIIKDGGKLTNKNRYNYFLRGHNNFNDSHQPTGKTSEGGIVFTYPQLNIADYK